MISSILKKSKSLTIKIVVGIIILPFLFWGMGDVFRGGNQNILINIDNEKVSTQEFMNYLRSLNLSKEDIESLKQGNLLDKIVSEYIGKKVGSFEIKKIGIEVTDQSLKDIITQDELVWVTRNQLNFSMCEQAKAIKLGQLIDSGELQIRYRF